MLVILGAGGRTGLEILKEALRRGMAVRPVVRDDNDASSLEGVVGVNQICYANASYPDSLPPVLAGADAVISCIDARTAGHGSPEYDKQAAANVVMAAAAQDVARVMHLSVIGGYRWSKSRLNRRGFHMDKYIKLAGIDTPWTLCRVSCYHDEIIDGHVRPPDGGRPHPIHPSSRYAPISRRDCARLVLDVLPDLIPGRTLQIGGPEIYSGIQLQGLAAAYRSGSGQITRYDPLPNGDMAVTPGSTRVSIGLMPHETLAWALDPASNPLSEGTAPFWQRPRPGPHPADSCQTRSLLSELGEALRYVIHDQLIADLGRMGLPTEGVRLDFDGATRAGSLTRALHGGQLSALDGVRALSPDGALLHRGGMTFVFDELADMLLVWWVRGDGMPEAVWTLCDLGVRRRLIHHPIWQSDPQVRAFAADRHERVS
ncbi:MAG: hypothetical protein ACI8RZ_007355 [Myxococcota bacterium]|jgi:uncharacterized protein YbjT (DUF2867 family)